MENNSVDAVRGSVHSVVRDSGRKDCAFDFLSKYLFDRLSVSVPAKYGYDDVSPKKNVEAMLCDLFEKHVYKSGDGYFLIGGNGMIYVYNGRYYERVETDTFVREVIKNTLTMLDVGIVYQKFSHRKIAEECISGIENRHGCKFVPDRRYIVFNNGVLDIKTGKLNDFSSKYRTDLILDIDYNKYAVHELWDNKLYEIIPNEDMRNALQMFCGSLLVNRDEIKIEYVCFLLGPGSNGKSIIAGSVASAFGDKYFSKFKPSQLLTDVQSMYNIASLDGMIGNFTDDLDKKDISGGDFKRFASGEEFQARHPYGRKIFKVKAPPLLCCANDMPTTTDDSWGYHRRILPVYSSTRTWSEKDKDATLKSKLTTEEARMAIFNWVYDGYKKIIANGGNIPLGDEVIQAQIDLRDDSNSARRWIRDSKLVKIDPENATKDNWKSLADWHAIYKQFCLDNGEANIQISKSISKIFQEKGFAQKRGSKGMMFCIGTMDESGGIVTKDEDLPF